ncbi:class I adenylate-forming enzyme family protein [Rhodococcoides kyotonense]|uniref:Acyl-CoA synthetase (AMP-forming)/AMP-acid ligase II n=1 Tax=Rhodococcoides kyotonense TaxID=398843 RepID=A0A239M3H2_9NOCA|nr:class I adenylate-forming enzyme family protein [Rhodococcus kyotonensis]SNT36698.1 Acyl-CoA synthetase (AMP-forming)/AMP-acid ligase II [Rhodococcus kyotonensis]
MNVAMLLSMAAASWPDETAIVEHSNRIRRATYGELGSMAGGGARLAVEAESDAILFIGVNGVALPVALFAAARAGIPFVPLNYRLADDKLAELVGSFERPIVIADKPGRVTTAGAVYGPNEWLDAAATTAPLEDRDMDAEAIAVLLYTSGTTAAPKAAVLRNRHLVSYILGTVEFGAGGPSQASLVSVPPYHIAAVANLLSNLYAGRRLVYLDRFDPEVWLDMADSEGVTHSMVVPTMLARICDYLTEHEQKSPPVLAISYGGARMPVTVLAQALDAFPNTGFVNAYGLTETASTIALLGPDEHREAFASGDPAVRARLGSVGRPVPGVTIGVFDEDGNQCEANIRGELRVRGPQVSGEYLGKGSLLSDDGWFHTRDQAYVDGGGYVFIEGRMDDTIIRGGENIAPAEIEESIVAHEFVSDAGVVGVADDDWGQRIAAHVVLYPGKTLSVDDVRAWVRSKLRSSKTPDDVIFHDELPRTDTGKLLRRLL